MIAQRRGQMGQTPPIRAFARACVRGNEDDLSLLSPSMGTACLTESRSVVLDTLQGAERISHCRRRRSGALEAEAAARRKAYAISSRLIARRGRPVFDPCRRVVVGADHRRESNGKANLTSLPKKSLRLERA
jgi:hypothetical protein